MIIVDLSTGNIIGTEKVSGNFLLNHLSLIKIYL